MMGPIDPKVTMSKFVARALGVAIGATDEASTDRSSHSSSLAIGLAILSFVTYACTVFDLPHVQNARFCCERYAVAAAVSNIMYGAPLGTYYSDVLDYFFKRRNQNDSLTTALEDARVPGIGLPATAPGVLIKTIKNGNGVGYLLLTTAAFRIFGMHAWALQLIMLLLMTLSAATFLCRFRSATLAGVVILYFSALTLMLFMPIVWNPAWAFQLPIGGLRFFSLVSVLPIFHILLELLDPHPSQGGTAKRNLLLLAVQSAILLLAGLARGTALPSIGGIAIVCATLGWRGRHNPNRLRVLLRSVAVMSLVSVGTVTAIAVAVPRDYITEGRFGPTIWERVIAGMGANPAWPFDGVNDSFDCRKYIPTGVQSGYSDDNAKCIWFDYGAKHEIPIGTSIKEINDGNYEAALREAFFKITEHYPNDVLQTFFYYKPRLIVWSIVRSVSINFGGDPSRLGPPEGLQGEGLPVVPYPPVALALLLVSLAVGLFYFGIVPISTMELRWIAGVTLLSALFTLPSYFVAWAAPYYTGDLLLFLLFGLGLAAGAILVFVRTTLAASTLPAGVDKPKK